MTHLSRLVSPGRRRNMAAGVAAAVAAFAALALPAGSSLAGEAYPVKSVRVIVPFAAGGPTDVSARLVMERLSQLTGQTFIVENRAGASGQIGTELVKDAAPDGYTLLVGAAATMTMLPALESNLRFDASRDFASIVMLSKFPLILAVPASSGISTVQQLMANLRANPTRAAFGSAGIGATSHLAAAMFGEASGVRVVHAPYKGTGPALADLLGGRLSYGFDSPSVYGPHIRAGKLVGLGVTDSVRSPALPNVPTMAEAGLPNFYNWTPWNALFAPKGTPPGVLERLNREVGRIVAEPTIVQRFADMGLTANQLSVAETQALVDRELRVLPPLIRAMKLQ